MSVTLGAFVSNVALLTNLDTEFDWYHQMSIGEAAKKGYDYLKEESGDSTHTPIDTRQLIGTVQPPIQNQHSVTFKISGVLPDPKTGRPERPYGWAQETGWHQKTRDGVAFHPGHHMVEYATLAARDEYVSFMTQPGLVRALIGGTRGSDVGGAFWPHGPVNQWPQSEE